MLTSEKVAATLDEIVAAAWGRTVASFMEDGEIDPDLRHTSLHFARNFALEGRESLRLQLLAFLRENRRASVPDNFGLPSLLMLTFPGWASPNDERLH